jgi:hypothetical protein
VILSFARNSPDRSLGVDSNLGQRGLKFAFSHIKQSMVVLGISASGVRRNSMRTDSSRTRRLR